MLIDPEINGPAGIFATLPGFTVITIAIPQRLIQLTLAGC